MMTFPQPDHWDLARVGYTTQASYCPHCGALTGTLHLPSCSLHPVYNPPWQSSQPSYQPSQLGYQSSQPAYQANNQAVYQSSQQAYQSSQPPYQSIQPAYQAYLPAYAYDHQQYWQQAQGQAGLTLQEQPPLPQTSHAPPPPTISPPPPPPPDVPAPPQPPPPPPEEQWQADPVRQSWHAEEQDLLDQQLQEHLSHQQAINAPPWSPQAPLRPPPPAGHVNLTGHIPLPATSQDFPGALPPPPAIPSQPKVVDASNIFRKPGRISRPEHFVVILRGLPGSGKSHLAKALRDVEVMNGGSAPRIHSIDDYFMSEVEKEVEEGEARLGKRPRRVKKKVIEYCYEPEMEEVYAASMFKAFKKTLEEGRFNFVIVDNWNLRVADFEQYWKAAKSSGYEVYVLEPVITDPAVCASRNTHGFKEEQLRELEQRWQPLPQLYLQLDATSLFREDKLEDGDIEEVEMDAEDMAHDEEADHEPVFKGKRARLEEDEEEPETPHHAPPAKPAERPAHGIFSDHSGPAKVKKNVRWLDQESEKEVAKGFRIGGQLQKKSTLEIGKGAGYSEADTAPVERKRGEAGRALWMGRVRAHAKAEAVAFRSVFARKRTSHDSDDD